MPADAPRAAAAPEASPGTAAPPPAGCADAPTPRSRAFWYGQLSGVVEPVAGVVGAAAVLVVQPALPYALAFAAGAMVFVVVEELIPASHRAGNTDLATVSTVLGFTVMMMLDVALGS